MVKALSSRSMAAYLAANTSGRFASSSAAKRASSAAFALNMFVDIYNLRKKNNMLVNHPW